MRSHARTALAIFGGAAAVAWTVGAGGLTTTLMSDTSSTTHPSPNVVQEHQQVATPNGNDTVHIATLTGCIAGANC